MDHISRNQRGVGLIELILIISVLILAVLASLFFWHQHEKKVHAQISSNEIIHVSGTILSDTCRPDFNQIPDTGCSIVVDGYTVEVEPGFNSRPFLGKVTGVDGNGLKGKHADIYAKKLGSSKTLDIGSSPNFYVNIY
jgi:hypothetical protein